MSPPGPRAKLKLRIGASLARCRPPSRGTARPSIKSRSPRTGSTQTGVARRFGFQGGLARIMHDQRIRSVHRSILLSPLGCSAAVGTTGDDSKRGWVAEVDLRTESSGTVLCGRSDLTGGDGFRARDRRPTTQCAASPSSRGTWWGDAGRLAAPTLRPRPEA